MPSVFMPAQHSPLLCDTQPRKGATSTSAQQVCLVSKWTWQRRFLILMSWVNVAYSQWLRVGLWNVRKHYFGGLKTHASELSGLEGDESSVLQTSAASLGPWIINNIDSKMLSQYFAWLSNKSITDPSRCDILATCPCRENPMFS